MWMQDTYEGYEGKYWSLPPRKILPKPYGKPHPPMWYAAGNTSSYEMAARKGLGVLGFSVGRPRRARAGASRRTRTAIANAEPIGAFVNDNIMVTHRGVRRRGPRRRRGAVVRRRASPTTCRATCSATTTRSRTPSGCRSGPSSSPSPTVDDRRAASAVGGDRHAATPTTRSQQCQRWEDAGADQLVFGIGPATARGHARDDPAHGRARDPEDRHRPRGARPRATAAKPARLSLSTATLSIMMASSGADQLLGDGHCAGVRLRLH